MFPSDQPTSASASRCRPRRCRTGRLGDRGTWKARPGRARRHDPSDPLDHRSGHGQLASGNYTWTGNVYVLVIYLLHLAASSSSSGVPAVQRDVLAGRARRRPSAPADVYGQSVHRAHNVALLGRPPTPATPRPGLDDEATAAGALSDGTTTRSTITFKNSTPRGPRASASPTRGPNGRRSPTLRPRALARRRPTRLAASQWRYHDPAHSGTASATPDELLSRGADLFASTQPHRRGRGRQPEHRRRAQHRNPVVVKPWIGDPNVKAVLDMWNAGLGGRHRHGAPAPRPGEPRRPHRPHVAGPATDSSLWTTTRPAAVPPTTPPARTPNA